MRWVIWLLPAVLLAAAAYELAIAVGLLGRSAIQDEDAVASIAALTILVGAVVAAVNAISPGWIWAVALIAPAAAAFVVTRFYSYDPYYLPSLRRYSDAGPVSPEWIFGMFAVSLAVGAATRLLPRTGSIATALILPILLFTSAIASSGH